MGRGAKAGSSRAANDERGITAALRGNRKRLDGMLEALRGQILVTLPLQDFEDSFVAAGAGATASLETVPLRHFRLQVWGEDGAGADATPTAWDLLLEGSLNNRPGAAHWETILQHSSGAGHVPGEQLEIEAGPYFHVRYTLASLTLGPATVLQVLSSGCP